MAPGDKRTRNFRASTEQGDVANIAGVSTGRNAALPRYSPDLYSGKNKSDGGRPARGASPTISCPRSDFSPMSRILLAEDDNDMRRFLVKALQNAGHDVVAFDNGCPPMSASARSRSRCS
jgi:hypothetical protein